MEKKTRKPAQKRSQEKYEKIIEAAYRLFNTKGYFNVTTADIAKEANVATGSVYAYFTDKKEIFIEILDRIHTRFLEPTKEFWSENRPADLYDEVGMKAVFKKFVELMMQFHDFSSQFHDDLNILEIMDEDVARLHRENMEDRRNSTMGVFEILGIPFQDSEAEEIYLHYCNLIIDDVCHRIIYDMEVQDKDRYINLAVDMLYNLLLQLTKEGLAQ